MLRIFSSVVAGALFVASTTAGAASPRAASPIEDGQQIAGSPWIPWVFGLIALIAIVVVVADDDEPASP